MFCGSWGCCLAATVCSIIVSATAVLTVVFVALVIGFVNNTSGSCHLRPVSRRNTSLIPAADDHLLVSGVVVLARGNPAFDDSAPFPSVGQSHGHRLRGSLTVLYNVELQWNRGLLGFALVALFGHFWIRFLYCVRTICKITIWLATRDSNTTQRSTVYRTISTHRNTS